MTSFAGTNSRIPVVIVRYNTMYVIHFHSIVAPLLLNRAAVNLRERSDVDSSYARVTSRKTSIITYDSYQ